MTPEERQEIKEHLRDALLPMGREVGELKQITQRIDDTLRTKQIRDAELQGQARTEIAEIKKDINGLGGKLSTHIAEHWKWLLATTGLVGAIMGAAKMLTG